jgi:diphthine synthase
MGSLSFIGLGLNDEKGISIEGLEEARRADLAFAEFYTNTVPNLNIERLERLIGKKITVVTRTQLEDESGKDIVTAAEKGRTVLFVPGDPMVATTHVSLRLLIHKKGIDSRIIHASSITSAICGATGLQSYKFGKSITIPNSLPLPNSVLTTLTDNLDRGLHTLLFLDIIPSSNNQLTVDQALTRIQSAKPGFENRLAIGVARLGSPDEIVKASKVRKLIKEDFGRPPHSVVVPGKLHFMEIETLKTFCGALDSDLGDNS